MRQKRRSLIQAVSFCAILLFVAVLFAVPAKAAGVTAGILTDRGNGQCAYTVQGLDMARNNTITLQIVNQQSQTVVLQKEIGLTNENCKDGTYNGTFSLEDVNRSYGKYDVNIIWDGQATAAGTCDFSLRTENLSMAVEGDQGSAERIFRIASGVPAGDVAVPGTDKQVQVEVWPEGTDEAASQVVVPKTAFTEGGIALAGNIGQTAAAYGSWTAKLVLLDSRTGSKQTLATGSYTVNPSQTSFEVKKSKTLEKKKAFSISLEGVKNVYGVSRIAFQVYNSQGKKVATVSGKKKKSENYSAEVTMGKLDNKLEFYTIKAVLTDKNGKAVVLPVMAQADQRAQSGTLSVSKKNNATCVFKLSSAYLPGNIKKAQFVLYKINGSKQKKLGSYVVKKTAGKNNITVRVPNKDTGKYKISVYGYTTWGARVFLNGKTFRLMKKHMGKNGWYYEKYGGKKYKFYYVNNEKQTDLTKVLNLEKSSSSHTNRMYIEINRAACTMTVYLYNKETKKYDIPIKTCAICVGSDTRTVAGAGGLNPKSYYTPIGTYSICTNGQSVKYTLKTMHEPDGKILYARWATHIVGNVYFHSIAVGTPSHYALPSYRYNLLGSPASAGCIRMAVADAKWIYDYASTGTKVKINVGNSKKPGPLGKNAVIKVTGGINYDPTDPGVPDSRKKKDYKAKRISGYMTKSGKRVGY